MAQLFAKSKIQNGMSVPLPGSKLQHDNHNSYRNQQRPKLSTEIDMKIDRRLKNKSMIHRE